MARGRECACSYPGNTKLQGMKSPHVHLPRWEVLFVGNVLLPNNDGIGPMAQW